MPDGQIVNLSLPIAGGACVCRSAAIVELNPNPECCEGRVDEVAGIRGAANQFAVAEQAQHRAVRREHDMLPLACGNRLALPHIELPAGGRNENVEIARGVAQTKM